MNIGDIKWPEDKTETLTLILNIQVQVLSELKIDFSNYQQNPTQRAKMFLNKGLSEKEHRQDVEYWWDFITEHGGIRDFQTKEVLMARLALSVLAVKEDIIPEIGEHLSWFFQYLYFLGYDIKKPLAMMNKHFSAS